MNNHMKDDYQRLFTNALRVLYDLDQLDQPEPANPELSQESSQEPEPPVEIDKATLRRWMAEIGWERQSKSNIERVPFSCPHCGKIVQLDMHLVQNRD